MTASRREARNSSDVPAAAAKRKPCPSKVKMPPLWASQRRRAFVRIVSNTGCTPVVELLMTRKISLVAVCCSSASIDARVLSCRSSPVAFSRSRLSARRFSRSRTLEPSFFCDLRATRTLASTLGFVGFAPRRIGPSLLLTGAYDRAVIEDRLGEGRASDTTVKTRRRRWCPCRTPPCSALWPSQQLALKGSDPCQLGRAKSLAAGSSSAKSKLIHPLLALEPHVLIGGVDRQRDQVDRVIRHPRPDPNQHA